MPGRSRRSGLVAAVLAGALVGLPMLPAAAAPGEDAARSERDAVAARVETIERQVEQAEDALTRITIEAEAASGAVLEARAAVGAAKKTAVTTAAALARAEASVATTQDSVSGLGREAYMGGSDLGELAGLLDAGGPGELLQRAATLEVLGDNRARALGTFEALERTRERADRDARTALEERDETARTAARAEYEVAERLADAQRRFDAMAEDKAELARQLKRAEIRLLELENTPDPVAVWQRVQVEEDAGAAARSAVRSTGAAVAPTTGRVTSCYGARWGTMHLGVDIAAPIGTPVHTPEPGIVLEAGPASGFGQAVYVQHADGAITLYGHVSRIHVSPGQTVTAGQHIADVGNEGQSTGPHLHFEVHTGGLYANRENPMPWLSSRGISLGGC